jgi:predicted nucleotide-binding protein
MSTARNLQKGTSTDEELCCDYRTHERRAKLDALVFDPSSVSEMKMTKIKPALFIASSVEGLGIADAINANLEHDAHCTIWRTGTFKLSSQTVDDLVKKSSAIDFAVFAFTPDDVCEIRDHKAFIARDNVVFELGLFIGAIGKDRCYVVKPRGIDMHLPSDLLGLNVTDYATDRPDADIGSALNYACKQVKDRIAELGAISRIPNVKVDGATRHVANPPDYKLHNVDLLFLAECVKSRVTSPEGRPFHVISNQIQYSDHELMLSAIKLDRLGYIEKSIEQDQQGYGEFYAYRATDDGMEILLKNEARIIELSRPAPRTRSGYNSRPSASTPTGFDDMDDDIPF